MIPNSVIWIGDAAFATCTSLTSVTIPKSLNRIGSWTFYGCTSLTSVTIPNSVTSIWYGAFSSCTNLTEVYFKGDAPNGDWSLFEGDNNTAVYYLPGTMGWGPTFGDRPTAPWVLPHPLILSNSHSFGVETNAFGFIISWATHVSVVVEACTDLANPIWSPVSTNTLTDGWSYFSDAEWTNYPALFYRLRSP